jgi:hypothetical protein
MSTEQDCVLASIKCGSGSSILSNCGFGSLLIYINVADPDPGWVEVSIRIRDEQPGSYFIELGNHFFGSKHLNSLMRIRDEQIGSGMEKSRIRDKHPGSATLIYIYKFKCNFYIRIRFLILNAEPDQDSATQINADPESFYRVPKSVFQSFPGLQQHNPIVSIFEIHHTVNSIVFFLPHEYRY